MKNTIYFIIIVLISGILLLSQPEGQASTSESDLQELLKQGRYKEIEDILNNILQSKEKDSDGRSLLHTKLIELSMMPSDKALDLTICIDMHLEWVKLHPNSHFANMSLGLAYVNYAWNARTDKSIRRVNKIRRELFGGRIRLATPYLLKAYELDPTDPAAPIEMITIAMVHPDWPDHRVRMEKWFQTAIATDPTDLKAYRSKLNFLHPRWGGSYDEQLAFSRKTLKNAPKNSMAPWILTATHWGIYEGKRDKFYFTRFKVWSEMKKTYTELEKRFPRSLKIRNWFAKTACLAGDLLTAKKEFVKIEDNWHKDVWVNRDQFDYYKKIAFMKTEQEGVDSTVRKKETVPAYPDPVFRKTKKAPVSKENKTNTTSPDPVFAN